MKKFFKHIATDKILRITFTLSAISIVAQTAYTLFFYFSLPPFIPLYNQLPWGEDRLGTQLEIFIPLGIVFCFLWLNFFLVNHLYEKMPLISRILGITTFLLTILTFIFNLQTLRIIL